MGLSKLTRRIVEAAELTEDLAKEAPYTAYALRPLVTAMRAQLSLGGEHDLSGARLQLMLTEWRATYQRLTFDVSQGYV